uniref:Uncharacterized protein n=1 Tax=Anguilla anguilla TaxID=7936 RepID=A0A0E9R795_ANGAN
MNRKQLKQRHFFTLPPPQSTQNHPSSVLSGQANLTSGSWGFSI